MPAPVVAVGDGALGFWAAVRDVWPETREQRDWCHKMGNVLDKLPTRLQPKAKRALRKIMYAETHAHAEEALDGFLAAYEAKYPKAAACLAADRDRLLTHFDLPAEHWQHIRTSNVVESSFATVRLRQRERVVGDRLVPRPPGGFLLLERPTESRGGGSHRSPPEGQSQKDPAVELARRPPRAVRGVPASCTRPALTQPTECWGSGAPPDGVEKNGGAAQI